MDDKNSITKLIQAGDNDRLKELLAQHSDLANEKTEQGISILMFAAYCRNNVAVELIKQNKTSLDIYEAIVLGYADLMKKELAKDPSLLNSFSIDGFTPIGLACFFGQLEIVNHLISSGSDINKASNNDFKVAPLHSACAISSYDIAEILIKQGAQVNARQLNDVTPLHSTAHNGQLKLTELLINSGADITAQTTAGKTPLQMAKEKGHPKVAYYLESKEGHQDLGV